MTRLPLVDDHDARLNIILEAHYITLHIAYSYTMFTHLYVFTHRPTR